MVVTIGLSIFLRHVYLLFASAKPTSYILELQRREDAAAAKERAKAAQLAADESEQARALALVIDFCYLQGERRILPRFGQIGTGQLGSDHSPVYSPDYDSD